MYTLSKEFLAQAHADADRRGIEHRDSFAAGALSVTCAKLTIELSDAQARIAKLEAELARIDEREEMLANKMDGMGYEC